MALIAFFVLLAAVVVLAGALARRKVRRTVEGELPVVTDETLRRILAEGSVETPEDPPLDEDAIREAEDRFWEERWDEPEEGGWR